MAKWIRNQYDKALTYEKLMNSHKRSKSGKGLRREVILFSLKEEEYIEYLYEKLKTGTYIHGKYSAFKVYEPKERIIEKAPYIDRIVHRWIVDSFLNRYFVNQFIDTSYACIKNRGMHKASIDVQNTMKHCKRIWQNYYILKMDIRKYFQNIDKDILMNILKRKVKEEKLVKLLEKIVYSNSGKKGLPIGNYTSQIFANIYLNEIDQYIKHELKVKYYFRYMDDSILFVKTKKEAIELLEKIKNYLKIKLELELNDKTQIFKSDQGVNFCGYKINEYRLKLRDRGKKAIKQKVRYLKEEVQKGNMNSKEASRFICGHLGYMKYANTRNLEEKLFYIN